MAGKESYAQLVSGYQRFLQESYPKSKKLYENLAEFGQSPRVCFVACCDSRVDPAVLSNTQPGDIFVIRNVANLVPPCCQTRKEQYHSTSAALQYAVMHLEVEHIVVLGQSQCGGIAALLSMDETQTKKDVISDWVSIAEPARHQLKNTCSHLPETEQACRLEQLAMQVSLDNLRSFPDINARIKEGKLSIHAWHFDIKSGQVSAFDPESNHYLPLS